MALLEIKNLHVAIDGKEILKGLDLTVNAGEVHAIMGPNGSGKSTLAYVLAGKEDYEPTAGEVLFNGKNLFDMAPDERAADGLLPRLPISGGNPRRHHHDVPAHRAQCAAQEARRGRTSTPEFIKTVREAAGSSASSRTCCAAPSMSAFPAAKRNATRFSRWRCSSRSLPSSTRPIPASTSTRCKIVADGVNRLRSPSAPSSSSRIISGCSTTSCRTSCTSVERPHRQDRRQGIGARARSARLCRVSGRGFGVNAGVTTIKTAAETALAQAFRAGAPPLPGEERLPRSARRLSMFRQGGPAAPPRRGMEIHRPARADARGQAARDPPDAAAKAARKIAGALLGDIEARRLVFVDGAFVAELSDTAELEPGAFGRFARRCARRRRSGADRASRQARAGKRCRGRAQYRLDGRRRGDPHRRGFDHRAAAASFVRRLGKTGGDFRALAGRCRSGGARYADREP